MDKVDIICWFCKERVGYVIPDECEVPLTGDMIHPHRGCEHWPLPKSMHGPIEFICPHAQFDEGDHHLFIFFLEGDHDKADTFLGADHQLVKIFPSVGECPCGCGRGVKEGNKYANKLDCYRKHMATLKTEIEDGSSED